MVLYSYNSTRISRDVVDLQPLANQLKERLSSHATPLRVTIKQFAASFVNHQGRPTNYYLSLPKLYLPRLLAGFLRTVNQIYPRSAQHLEF